jgi:hypothetical protein
MRGGHDWANRTGPDADTKRATLTVAIPRAARPWIPQTT